MAERTRVQTRFGTVTAPPEQAEAFRRIETFGPPSEMASQEDRQAYQAYQLIPEIQAGRATIADLPEAYGGRPTGTSRRAIRMREEYDKQQADMLERQRLMQQMEMEQKRFALQVASELRQQRDQDLATESRLAKEKRESDIQQEAKFIFETVRGGRPIGTNPDGTTKYSEPLNPQNPESVETLYRLSSLPYGMQNQAAKEVVTMMLDDALRVQETIGAQALKQAEQQQAWLIGQQEEASSLGIDTSKFFTTKIDPQTQQPVVTGVDQLGLSKAIGEAKSQEAQKRQMEIKEAKVSDEIRSEAKDVLKGIEEIDKQIREQNFMASREQSETNRDAYLARAEYLRGERDVLTTRFQNLIPQKQAEQPQQGMTAPQQERQLSQRDQAALNWANSNPNDPRSQRIKQRLGVQ